MSAAATVTTLADISAAGFAAALPAKPVILLPLGSHEDHGPLMPMGDFVSAGILATRIAAAATGLGAPCFAAPTLPFGAADYFGGSPGGLAISPASFRAVLDDLLAGLLRHGLNRIVILNGHGGNAPIIHEVTLAVRATSGIVIPSVYLWKIAATLMRRRLGPAAASFEHGGEPLLSLTRALRPAFQPAESTTESAARPAGALLGLPVSGFGTLDFEGVAIDAPATFDMLAGDPARAADGTSAALGGAVADDLVALAARFVVHYARATVVHYARAT